MRSISLGQQDEFIRRYLFGLNCPRALSVWLLYSNKEHSQLVSLEFNPLDYNDLNSARDSLAATKFLSKATFLDLNIDLKKVALDKFHEAEQACKETNRRIKSSRFKNPLTASALLSMSRKIDLILGDFDAEEFVDSCGFGPGATTSLPRRQATHPKKYDSENRINREAYEFVSPWFHSAYPLWDIQFEVSGGSKIVTVPKNAKTDRTIAIEPGINLWFQKGIGTIIRRRLRRVGIDLNDQRFNQAKSRIASKFNHLATVDFSSASDTISKALVDTIMPQRWGVVLNSFRSSFGFLDGHAINFEKFSSMGNGFTFELETLIFYTLGVFCCEHLGYDSKEVSVYGDDVVIPSGAFDLYSSLSSDLGFTVNKSKSYSSSYYRESCGSHYWNGVDVKPIFQKEPLDGKASLLLSANNVRRYAHRRNSYGCDRRLRSCFQYAERLLKDVPRISDGFGDIGLIENIDHPAVSVSTPTNGFEGHYVRVWAPIAYTVYCESKGLLLHKLKTMGISLPDQRFDPLSFSELCSSGNNVALPNRTRYARLRLLIPRWHDLGPWI